MDYLKSLGLASRKYILAVGRITPEKGFDYLIKAFRLAAIENFSLVIAGGVEAESSYGEELKDLAKGTNVVFSGFVQGEKLEQLYTNARLYVLSSLNEGFPLVLLEAMSYGLDVLVSDIPATHLVELSPDDYFDKENVESLAQGLLRKINSPLVKREYQLDDFDWQKIANRTGKIYHSLL